MLRLGTIVTLVAGLVAFGCGGTEEDFTLEEAAMASALAEGDGESLDGVQEGDAEGAADEQIDDALEEEGILFDDCSLAGVRQRLVAHYDQDGNGELSRGELQALREDFGPLPLLRVRWARHHRWLKLRWIYDADESGHLSPDERQQLREDLQARCEARKAQLLENFDADGDGQLNPQEWQAARQALRERREERRQAILDEYDANDNGHLDPIERSALKTDVVTRILEIRQEVKEQFDADGSGYLDEAERAALREYLRSRIRGEYFGEEGRF